MQQACTKELLTGPAGEGQKEEQRANARRHRAADTKGGGGG